MQCPVRSGAHGAGKPVGELGQPRRIEDLVGLTDAEDAPAAPPLDIDLVGLEADDEAARGCGQLGAFARAEHDLFAIEEVVHRMSGRHGRFGVHDPPDLAGRQQLQASRTVDLLQLGPPCGGSAVNKRHTVNDRRCIAGQQGPKTLAGRVVRNVRRQGRRSRVGRARATPDRGPRPGPRRRRRAGRRGGQRRRPGTSRAAARGRRSDANALTTGATPSRKVLWPTGKADRPWLLQRRRIHDVSSDSRGRARTCAYEWASTGWAGSGGI